MREQTKKVRREIFEACSRILINEGLTNLTLDAVAEEAGISKGGLLYHFPTKNQLIDCLFEYHNNIYEERLLELVKEEGDIPGAYLRAYARASIEQILDPETAKLYASLFAAEERYASAHKLMREKYIDWQREIESCGIDPTVATFVRLTVDGLWFSEMHHYAPPDIEHRNKILAFIIQITYNPELLEKVNSYH